QISQDTLQEGDETFALILGNLTGGASLGSQAITTVHITDDDVAGSLQFSQPQYSFVEGNLTAQVFVTRIGGNSGAVSADVTVNAGNATDGVDYVAPQAPVTVQFADGDTTPKAVTFQISQDTLQEGDETFALILGNLTGGASLGSQVTSIVQILDDDVAGSLHFSAATYTFNETVSSAIVYVNRDGGTSGAVSVHYSTSNGTAVSPEDYTNAEGTLTWADGDSLPKPIVIPVFTDSELDSRFFSVVLDGSTGDAVLDQPEVTEVTILDVGVGPQLNNNGIQGGSQGGCSLNPDSKGLHGTTAFGMMLAGLALSFTMIRFGRSPRWARVSTQAALIIVAVATMTGCGDGKQVRNPATLQDYELASQTLQAEIAALWTPLSAVTNCDELDTAASSMNANPVLDCDSGFIHTKSEVKSCQDQGGLAGLLDIQVIPENCISQEMNSTVEGDYAASFGVDPIAGWVAELSTEGLDINDTRYQFKGLKLSIAGNGNIQCEGYLTDGMTTCFLTPDCATCDAPIK
ncbi:MAG: hypothetical protein K8R69_02175, partial [Deltaproteobacteria bacterium]|nr:hypothetical protein [Deltaproteobacteria bacterium]